MPDFFQELIILTYFFLLLRTLAVPTNQVLTGKYFYYTLYCKFFAQ